MKVWVPLLWLCTVLAGSVLRVALFAPLFVTNAPVQPCPEGFKKQEEAGAMAPLVKCFTMQMGGPEFDSPAPR